jgi:hypothetical protein
MLTVSLRFDPSGCFAFSGSSGRTENSCAHLLSVLRLFPAVFIFGADFCELLC